METAVRETQDTDFGGNWHPTPPGSTCISHWVIGDRILYALLQSESAMQAAKGPQSLNIENRTGIFSLVILFLSLMSARQCRQP